jgi:hypothetical protein
MTYEQAISKGLEWVTNIKADLRQQDDTVTRLLAQSPSPILGDPKPTEHFTVAQLKSFGIVGVYRQKEPKP